MKINKYLISSAIVAAFLSISHAYASEELAQSKNCLACHNTDQKLVGPSFKEIAGMYGGDAAAADTLAGKIINGGGGVWGQIPMPPNPGVSEEEAKALVDWILSMQ